MSVEENKAIVHRFNDEAWNKGNPAIVDELFAPDYVAHMAGTPQLDREQHKQFIATTQAAFRDAHSTFGELIAEGSRVAYRWTYSGTHTGEFQGIPPTGRQMTLPGISIWRVERGKIVESWHEFDALGMLQQLGVIPAPAPASA